MFRADLLVKLVQGRRRLLRQEIPIMPSNTSRVFKQVPLHHIGRPNYYQQSL